MDANQANVLLLEVWLWDENIIIEEPGYTYLFLLLMS